MTASPLSLCLQSLQSCNSHSSNPGFATLFRTLQLCPWPSHVSGWAVFNLLMPKTCAQKHVAGGTPRHALGLYHAAPNYPVPVYRIIHTGHNVESPPTQPPHPPLPQSFLMLTKLTVIVCVTGDGSRCGHADLSGNRGSDRGCSLGPPACWGPGAPPVPAQQHPHTPGQTDLREYC